MSDTLIEVNDLKIHFFTDEGVVRAVDGVDLTIERGKTLCLVGESGCGKSVACRAFLQIVHSIGKIVSGEIIYHRRVDNNFEETIDIAQLNPKGRQIREIRGKEISMIFQEPMTSLSPMYTVGNQIMENILLHTNLSKEEARQLCVQLLDQVGIPQPHRLVDEYPFRLSGGMRQRAMIAMALSCNPTLLIADEPTTALDVTTQANILDLMRNIQKEYQMALLFITHDLGVVAEIADTVAVMYLGKIVESGDVDTIFNNPKHPYTQALLRSIPKISRTREKLDTIQGMVPNPYRRPGGCPFHPRCTQAMPECSTMVPSVTRFSDGHTTRCLLYENITTKQFAELS
ncbi:MAG: ABC transporter ATP-binding protein [Ardenticatenaceae bacterium]|nr:ABC transporter ATP-binding protein [Ardenticatenaceae bacterium]